MEQFLIQIFVLLSSEEQFSKVPGPPPSQNPAYATATKSTQNNITQYNMKIKADGRPQSDISLRVKRPTWQKKKDFG